MHLFRSESYQIQLEGEAENPPRIQGIRWTPLLESDLVPNHSLVKASSERVRRAGRLLCLHVASTCPSLVRDHKHHLRHYRHCCSGKELVDAVLSAAGHSVQTRSQALGLCQVLLDEGVLAHVRQDSSFQDRESQFYRFVALEPGARDQDSEELLEALALLTQLGPGALLTSILRKAPAQRTDEELELIFEELLHIKAVAHLSNSVKKELAAVLLFESHAQAGTVLFSQGDKGTSWYIIWKGSVNVVTHGKGLVTTLHEGDDFGQLALVNNAPRAASIILREDDCHLLRVDKRDFDSILRDVEANTLRLKEHGKVVLVLEKSLQSSGPSCPAAPLGSSRYSVMMGTPEKILEYLLETMRPDSSFSNPVDTFLGDFLLTHAVFLPPHHLCRALLHHFHTEPSEGSQQDKVAYTFGKKQKILRLVSQWALLYGRLLQTEPSATALMQALPPPRGRRAVAERNGSIRREPGIVVRGPMTPPVSRTPSPFSFPCRLGCLPPGKGVQCGGRSDAPCPSPAAHNIPSRMSTAPGQGHRACSMGLRGLGDKEQDVRSGPPPPPTSARVSLTQSLFKEASRDPRLSPLLREPMQDWRRTRGSDSESGRASLQLQARQSMDWFASQEETPMNSSYTIWAQDKVPYDIYRPDQSCSTVVLPVNCSVQEVLESLAGKCGWERERILVKINSAGDKVVLSKEAIGVCMSLGLNERLFAVTAQELCTLMPHPEQFGPTTGSSETLDLISSKDLAGQLTEHDWNLFHSLHQVELLYYIFGQQHFPGATTANLERFLRRFNELQFWVVTELCLCSEPSRRAQLLRKFIKMAAYLKEQKNLNSFFAVMFGLSHSAVSRLARTWERLPHKSRKLYNTLERMLDPSWNHRVYRLAMAKLTPPIIPFMPLLLKDMTFIHEGNRTLVEGLVNFEKLRMMAKAIHTLQRCRSHPHVPLSPLRSRPQHLLDEARAVRISTCSEQSLSACSPVSTWAYFQHLRVIDNQKELARLSRRLES